MNKIKLIDLPKEERPREKLLSKGASSLSNGELLAILLHSGTKEKSALDLANDILIKIKDLDLMTLLLNPNSLSSIKGIGPAKAATLIAAIELGLRLAQNPTKEKMIIDTPQKAASYAMPILRYKQQEHFYIMLLDTKKQMIAFKEVSVGIANAVLIHPREVFKIAIEYSAASIILFHNHPSGDVIPSKDDIDITKKFKQSGEILSINLIDHIIIGDNKFYSLKSENMLE